MSSFSKYVVQGRDACASLQRICTANVDVARRVLSPSSTLSPEIVEVATSQKTDLGLVLYANSITLTPGTITVEAEGGEFLVHGLTKTSAAGCVDSEMDRRVRRFEGSA